MTQRRRSQLWPTSLSATCHGTASSCPGLLTVESSRPFWSRLSMQKRDLTGKTTPFPVMLRVWPSQASSQLPGTGSVCAGCTEEPFQTPFLPTPSQVQRPWLGFNFLFYWVSSLLSRLSVSTRHRDMMWLLLSNLFVSAVNTSFTIILLPEIFFSIDMRQTSD